MPIEFHCPHCNQLLRTPDGSHGRDAKCTNCSQVVTIPDAAATGPETPEQQSPFAVSGPTGDQSEPFHGETNPYAAPTTMPSAPRAAEGRAELSLTRIAMDEIIGRTWQMFTEKMGPCVLFGLIVIAIQMGSSVVSVPLQFAQEAMGNEPVIVVGLNVFQQLWGQAVQALVVCVSIPFGLNLVRGNAEPLSGIFGRLNHWPVIFGFQLLMVLIFAGVALVCALPVVPAALTKEPAIIVPVAGVAIVAALTAIVFIGLKLFLTTYFIIDRNTPLFEAISQSNYFMQGNKGTTFVTMLVVGILGSLFAVITCCIGAIFVIPYMTVVGVVIYVSATGQWAG